MMGEQPACMHHLEPSAYPSPCNLNPNLLFDDGIKEGVHKLGAGIEAAVGGSQASQHETRLHVVQLVHVPAHS